MIPNFSDSNGNNSFNDNTFSEKEFVDMESFDLDHALYSWDEIHGDKSIGFVSKCKTLFFGKAGGDCIDNPYITFLSSGKEKNTMHIYVEDLHPLDWCIAHAIGGFFDEYENYNFSAEKWQKILAEAERLLYLGNFDTLFDETIAWGILFNNGLNCMMSQMNTDGAEFWSNREQLRIQLHDICAWSELVLAEGDKMLIYGA